MKRNRRRVSVQLKLSAFCCNKTLYKLSKLYNVSSTKKRRIDFKFLYPHKFYRIENRKSIIAFFICKTEVKYNQENFSPTRKQYQGVSQNTIEW